MAIKDYRIGLFDRLNGDSFGLSDDDKDRATRQGLLGLAAGLLGTGGGFGNALGAGIQTGLLAMNQGADSVVKDRYRAAMMQRTMQGAERNSQVEALRSKVVRPDGTIDQAVWPQYVAADPEGAKQIRDALSQPGRKNPGQPVYVRNGEFEDPYFWDDQAGGLVPAGNFLAQGPLAGAVASQPQIGIASETRVPAAAGPLMGQAFYDEIGKLISPYGATVGSTKGGEHNPGSLHYDGRALDIPLGASATDAVRANADRMIADLSNKGYTVRDERTRPAGQKVWSGPHLHVEAGGGAGSPAPFGRRPIKSEDARERYRTLSADEVQQMGLPMGTVAQQSPNGQIQIVNKPRDLPTGGQVVDNGDGTTTFIPAGKITEGERNAAGFYDRMVSASKQMDALTNAGYDPTNLRDFATTGRTATNFAATKEGQQYYQAAMNWVRANLRKESGAAIGVDEARQEIRNYFPQPGDSKEVLAQKAEQRRVVEAAMRKAAGGALPPMATPQADRPQSKRLKFNPSTGRLE